jgi:hypothetical protein
MRRLTAYTLAALFTLPTAGVYAQTTESAKPKGTESQTDVRKDDPCAEPEKKLKKKTTERKGTDKTKADAPKP